MEFKVSPLVLETHTTSNHSIGCDSIVPSNGSLNAVSDDMICNFFIRISLKIHLKQSIIYESHILLALDCETHFHV